MVVNAGDAHTVKTGWKSRHNVQKSVVVSVPKDLYNMHNHWSCLGCWRKLQYMYTDCVVVAVHLIIPAFRCCCSFSSSLYSSGFWWEQWLLSLSLSISDISCVSQNLLRKQTNEILFACFCSKKMRFFASFFVCFVLFFVNGENGKGKFPTFFMSVQIFQRMKQHRR